MQAMLFREAGQPLELVELPIPIPTEHEVLLKVSACGVCRTDLHIVDGELKQPASPLVPGHQIVGIVQATGFAVKRFSIGDRVGVPWLGQTCECCGYCINGLENLCEDAVFTGYQRPGGFAQLTTANEQFCFTIPDHYPDTQAAPLLCAGLIGYRAYRFAEYAHTIGFYGFGAAAHILCQLAVYQGRKIYAFTRTGDHPTQQFALKLGATWVGSSEQSLPDLLDAAIIFAPAGQLIPAALKAIKPGGKVICAGIHMSDIPAFPYDILWGERSLQSVANLTRRDGEEFLKLAPQIPIQTDVTSYPLSKTNQALDDLRNGRFNGAAVVLPWA
ncbi:MAG: zinc-dependent alcohol dehydrogenase family protein [Gammaproteobacteria bacterium]|nr:zinc-dependent alcohol dehydrogenase family protein [Gammaproteobacteria bacterium]